MLIWWLISIYAIGITLFLVLSQFRRSQENNVNEQFQLLLQQDLPTVERIKSLGEFAKIQQDTIPWYERSLSKMGVVAFFSMLIATGVQTIKATQDTIKVEQLRMEINALESNRDRVNELIDQTAQIIIWRYRQGIGLENSEKELLRLRLQQFDKHTILSYQDFTAAFELALAANDASRAVSFYNENIELLNASRLGDSLYEAEYDYLVGADEHAKKVIKKLRLQTSILPKELRLRFIILATLLEESDFSESIKEFSAVYTFDMNKAFELLKRRMNELYKMRADFG